jgi:hypothetical protein
MAVNAKINVSGTIGKATITQTSRSVVAAQNFSPKPNVSLPELRDVTTTGVQDGYTLIYKSNSGKFEAQPAGNVSVSVTNIIGGTF